MAGVERAAPAESLDAETRRITPLPGSPLPLTERILGSLPGPWIMWAVLWAGFWFLEVLILPRLFPEVTSVLEEETGFQTLAVSYANFIALWGTRKISRDVGAVGPALNQLTGGMTPLSGAFRGFGSVTGPLLLTTMLISLFVAGPFLTSPSLPLLIVALWGFVAWAPLCALLWAAGAVLLGLHRLGGMRLRLMPFEEDRSLGLRPLGALAFTPFLILVAALVPTWWDVGVGDLVDLLIDIGALAIGVTLLFASLLRLRRQMLAAKREHATWARGLYAQAVQSVRGGHSVDALQAQAAALQAAESLERHAAAIQEWPFDESLVRTMIAILTSVTTAILARLVLSRIGL